MAKVLLVKARPETKEANKIVMPPMGIMYIASYLQQFNHTVAIEDTQLNSFSISSFQKRIQRIQPDLIGISALTTSAKMMHSLACLSKTLLPKVKIVVGSHHPSCYPEQTLNDKHIDFVCIGEGEGTMQELVEALEQKRPVHTLKGIAFRQDGKIIRTPPRPPLTHLDTLPFPAWDLIPLDAYPKHTRMGVQTLKKSHLPYMSLVTSRGCPYHCFYCHELHGKRFRSRSAENVLSEIDLLYRDYGIRELHIIDDIFNFNLARAKEILRGIVRKGYRLKLHFPNALRGDRVDFEFLNLLKQAGTSFLAIAVDSAARRVQKLSRRNLKLDRVNEAITHATQLGLFTVGNFILGFPDETEKEMQATIDFARKSDFHAAFFYLLTPFPGSALEKRFRQQIPESLSDFNHFITDKIVWQSSKLSDHKLYQMRRKAYLSFYLSRKRLLRGPLRLLFLRLFFFLMELPNILFIPANRNGKSPSR